VDKQFQALEVVDILKMIFLEKFKCCYIKGSGHQGERIHQQREECLIVFCIILAGGEVVNNEYK
jgi:hypothetical protein